MPEALYRVVCDNTGVVLSDPKGVKSMIAWGSLSKVTVRTTDEGPLNPDVFWELSTDDASPAVTYPGGATGEGACIAVYQSRLKGFSDKELVRAMGSTQNASFVLWVRPASRSGK